MPFKKGDPRPANAGRKKGTPHKKSMLVREILDNHGINIVDQILVRLKQVNVEEQLRALVQMLPYCYPKLSAYEVSGEVNHYLEKSLEELEILVKDKLQVKGPEEFDV